MDLRKSLLRKGVSGDQITFISKGFIELLGDQLDLSVSRMPSVVAAIGAGRIEDAVAGLESIEQSIAHAAFSCQTAVAMMRLDRNSASASNP